MSVSVFEENSGWDFCWGLWLGWTNRIGKNKEFLSTVIWSPINHLLYLCYLCNTKRKKPNSKNLQIFMCYPLHLLKSLASYQALWKIHLLHTQDSFLHGRREREKSIKKSTTTTIAIPSSEKGSESLVHNNKHPNCFCQFQQRTKTKNDKNWVMWVQKGKLQLLLLILFFSLTPELPHPAEERIRAAMQHRKD